MKFAFCLIKYFPYGGLQRDFRRIAEECIARGHQVDVFTPEWVGDIPENFHVQIVPVKGFTNHGKRESLAEILSRQAKTGNYDAVVGFSKMPGLDVYYAADSCFAARAEKRSFLYRMTGRCRTYLRLEQAVFAENANTAILMISEQEKPLFQHYYRTPESRFHLLPPGISKDRLAPENPAPIRSALRAELGIGEKQNMVLLAGSGFRIKGADRAVRAIAALPGPIAANTFLVAVGKDNFQPFYRMAKRLGIHRSVIFFPGRDDIVRFFIAADLLIHPAYKENTGTVLIEAMAAGLPVLATDICGYSHHIRDAKAGMLIQSPFQQEELNRSLRDMLQSEKKFQWRRNGMDYVTRVDVFSLPQKAVDIIEKVAQ